MSAFVQTDNANDYRTTALRRVRGKDMTGKVMVVTGASGALGKVLIFAFYNAGATVIAAGRSVTKLEKAKEEVLKRGIPAKEDFTKVEGGSIECMALDLADYDSIDSFAKELGKKHPKIYTFINNAGMIPSQAGYKESKYGLETTFQVNVVSTIILTEKILPLLAKTEGARVVNMSSMSHADASKPIKFETIPSTAETFGGYNKDYAESKWLLTAYTAELARRHGVVAVSADPGASPDSAMWDEQTWIIRFLARYVFYRLTKTSPQAAAVSAHLGVAEDIENGGYYQSGVLVPPLREDTKDVENWKKVTAILEKVLPDDLKWCAKVTEP